MKATKSTVKRTDEEEVLKIMGDEAPVGVCIMQDGKFCCFNSNFPVATGYTADELMGKDSLEIVAPEDREMVKENTIKMLKGKLTSPYQFRVIHKDGSIVWIMATVKSIRYQGRWATLGSYMEITERGRMEEALKEREEKYRELADSITDVFFAVDEHLRCSYWNKASEILTGIRAEDAIGKSLREIFPDTPGIRKAEKVYHEVLRTQQSQTFVSGVNFGGKHYIFEISAYPSRGGISVFVKDITERKQAEDRLKESEQKYRLLFETSLDCIAQIDRDGRFLDANPAAARSLGVPLEELIGKTFFEVMPQEVAQRRLGNVRKVLDEWQPQIFEDERGGRYFHHLDIPIRISEQKETAQVITRDITESKQAEEKLRQSEENYRTLFNNSVTGMYVMDVETMKVVVGNRAAQEMAGFSSAEEGIGVNPFDFVVPEDREEVLEIAINEFLQDSRRTHEIQVMDKNGRRRWQSFSIARIMHQGKPASLVSFTDITERKQAEEALRRSEEKYRTILEEMEDSYFEVDLAGNITFANNSVCRDLGYSMEELIGKRINYKDYTVKEDIESVFRVFNEVYQTGVANKGFSWRTKRKDGIQGFAETSISLLRNDKGEIIGFRGVGRDVAERKQTEEKLRQSEENYKTLFDSAVVGMYVLDAETFKVVMGNRAAAEMAGFSSPGEGIGINPFDFVIPEDREQVLEMAVKEFEQDLRRTHEVRVIGKDGGIGWISISSARITHEGRPASLVSITNITERKQGEEALRQSEENYRALFDSSVIGTVVMDAETMKVMMVNQAAVKMFGFNSAEEALGLDPFSFILPEDRERYLEITQKGVFEQNSHQTYEIKAMTKDGRGIWINTTATMITHKGKLAALISFADITEQKKQTELLMMTDRLASLGELASGAAHEINNPLTSIIGFSQLLLEKQVPDDIREDLKLINNEAQRAASVTKNLLTFARRHAPTKQRNQINNIIEDVLKLRAYEHKANGIEVKRQLAPDLPEIMVDYFQMQQVFMNIVINAEYFMTVAHNKGTLTITTKKQNDTVMISFADDGQGIPSENLRRIFDPFFTTKETGKGTGLGLSICHGIVTEHGGQIYAKSQLSKGATIFVELPISGS